MATTRIMPLHVGKGRTESRAISDIIDYVDNGKLITGFACDSRTIDAGLWDCKKVSPLLNKCCLQQLVVG